MSGDSGQQFAGIRDNGQLARLRPDRLSYRVRIFPLAIAIAPFEKTQRESLHRGRELLRHKRRDRARIQPATQEDAERHIAHQSYSYGFAECLLNLRYKHVDVGVFRLELDIPISLN